MRKRKELGADLRGVNAYNSYTDHNSSPREAMFATQISQAPVVSGNQPKRIYTGVDLEYSKYTFDVKMPHDATVLRILEKYPSRVGIDRIKDNPLTSIIYETHLGEEGHKTIGVLHVPRFNSYHQDFGYPLKRRGEVWDYMAPGTNIGEGVVLAASSAVRDNGQYGIGLEAEVAFMSMPGTIEDGFVMSESFLKRMTPKGYNTLVANWGRKTFPLNLYGDETHYKPFPDIGDRIRPDGRVCTLRDYDENLGVAEMTGRALRTPDDAFDRSLYGKPGARVVDIQVYHDNRLDPAFTPEGMDTQARKYYDALVEYYQTVIAEYKRLTKRWGSDLRLTDEFRQLVLEAQIFLPTPDNLRKLSRVYRLEQLDEWRVEITFEYDMHSTDGYKFTDIHGGKGVTCKTVPDDHMPVDAQGNRAEVVIYGGSTIKRMNIGRLYEQFINAASRDLCHRLRESVGFLPRVQPTAYQLAQLTQEQIEPIWDTLMRYYGIVAPLQYDLLVNDPDHARHVKATLHDGIYLFIPPDNPVNNLEMIIALRDSEFCPHYAPVTYRNNGGTEVTTARPVLIGSLYMLMLEKTGDDWSGVASVKTNHFGVASKLNNFDKQTSPGRQQSVRGAGESETRSFVCTIGPEATMELMDQSNNPDAHRFAVKSVLQAPKPTHIAEVVDRRQVPFGGARPVALVRHFMACRGVKFLYRSDTETTGEPA